jgi:acetate kinase
MKILVINHGSSTIKSALFDLHTSSDFNSAEAIWKMKAESAKGNLEALLSELWQGPEPVIENASDIEVVGHRVVHGGSKFQAPVIVDERNKADLKELIELAPDHNAPGMNGIEQTQRLFPDAKQIAIFDTAFHKSMPLPSTVYGLPFDWFESGIRRYGFHGINHEYVSLRAANLLNKPLKDLRMVSCHLGSGCSLTAIKAGKSIDTTMGFSPLEGVVMGTRCGSVDPGILLFQLKVNHYKTDQLDDELRHHSGLKGLCGTSDMQEIVNRKGNGNKQAELAFDVYVHSIVRHAGSMMAVLNGLDVLIFTGGVGENSPDVREAVCASLSFAGVGIDPQTNAKLDGDVDVSATDASVRTLVIHAQEEKAIALQCLRVL